MKPLQKASKFAFGLLVTALALDGSSQARRRTWKSQTTGNEYRVWVEKDAFHAEWVNVPEDMARHGAYLHTLCRYTGSKWVGTSESLLPCTEGEGPDQRTVNWCKLQTRTEIDSIARDRITGRGQTIKRVDCQSCKPLETGWAAFVWVPKR
ncbi:MAG: hypothetical protein DMG27_12145 [Acidobacteria bacterium]|nr:MAG: hypothetical protein DMG27_12145 [Acidobacteriota bacterium]